MSVFCFAVGSEQFVCRLFPHCDIVVDGREKTLATVKLKSTLLPNLVQPAH